jgi:hypothetical protein
MMVTASPVLASAIKRNFDGMKLSAQEPLGAGMVFNYVYFCIAFTNLVFQK